MVRRSRSLGAQTQNNWGVLGILFLVRCAYLDPSASPTHPASDARFVRVGLFSDYFASFLSVSLAIAIDLQASILFSDY